jgi:hypothetical protein
MRATAVLLSSVFVCQPVTCANADREALRFFEHRRAACSCGPYATYGICAGVLADESQRGIMPFHKHG